MGKRECSETRLNNCCEGDKSFMGALKNKIRSLINFYRSTIRKTAYFYIVVNEFSIIVN